MTDPSAEGLPQPIRRARTEPLSGADAHAILNVVGRWADDASRCEYADQIRYRLWGGDLPHHRPPHEAYFPPFLAPRPDERFVDCGAYIGDTLGQFLAWTGRRFDRYYAIEPDIHNFRRLTDAIAMLPPDVAHRIDALALAVSSADGPVPFIMSGTDMSMVVGRDRHDSFDARVPATTLDALLKDEPPPTYIKMDIEGSEPDALLGASATIRLHRPLLAVCVYHELDHLWTIPDLIHAIDPDYSLILRRYGRDHWETVCYAVPPGRVAVESSP